ncbi:EXO70 family protein [Escherichia coli]|uniref:EXO70 family protein n=1 Tax=Escherichia coli TaxID=562 RepID=UPI003B9BB170
MAVAVDGTSALSFQNNLVESSVAWAEQMITRWDPNTPGSPHAKATSIYRQSRDEARRFLLAIYEIQSAMNSLADGHSGRAPLVHAEHLMETAMSRLQKEFAELLSPNPPDPTSSSPTHTSSADNSSTFRNYLTDSDGEDSIPTAPTSDYLHEIAECMISSGYAQECVEVYKHCRRSVVEDGMSRLLADRASFSHVHRLGWESLDSRVNQWLAVAPAVFAEVFGREKALCDRVFASSETIGDSCFAEITRDAAVELFRFPQEVTSKHKRPQEKVWHYLNMYRSIRDLSHDIESQFSSESTNVVRSQVDASLHKLAVTIRSMLADFESVVRKDNSKSVPPNGGLHVLTQTVMNHLVLLSDYYAGGLFTDEPTDAAPLPESLEPMEKGVAPEHSTEPSTSAARFVRLIVTTVLCKLDVKAELYKDASHSYLFLANNIQHVVNKARESKLAELLGHEWLSCTEGKARSFAKSFMKFSWSRVLEAVQGDPSELPRVQVRRERMVQFNKEFEEACKSHAGLVVLDEKVRNEIKSATARTLIGRYRAFYERCRAELRVEEGVAAAVRFAPEDLVNHLYGLYREGWGSFDLQSYHLGSVGKRSPWRWLKKSPSFFTTEKEKEKENV